MKTKILFGIFFGLILINCVFAEEFGVSLAVTPNEISVNPYEIAVYDISLENIGTQDEIFWISIENIPEDWYSLSHESIEVPAGETRVVYLFITPQAAEKDVYEGIVNINNAVNVSAGFRLNIIGWDKRYDKYENREARLVYRDGKMFLMIAKQIPKPEPSLVKGVLAIDINEEFIYIGNSSFIERVETAVDRALHFKKLAENLQRKFSFGKYRAWLRSSVLKRITCFHRKAKNIIEDWARKTALKIVLKAKQNNYTVAREDLNGLIGSLRRLPKEHRVKMITLSYGRLINWIDWQAMKHGVRVVVVNPNGTSSICPLCRSKLIEGGYRTLRCSRCGFKGDRDEIALLNIEKRATAQMEGVLAPPTAPQMKDVDPNRCGEPMNPLKGTLALRAERRSDKQVITAKKLRRRF